MLASGRRGEPQRPAQVRQNVAPGAVAWHRRRGSPLRLAIRRAVATCRRAAVLRPAPLGRPGPFEP